MKAELHQLVALQKLDTSIRRLQTELETIPQKRAEIENEFDRRAFEIRALESRRDEARHTRARLETEIGDQRSRVERAERNLMSSKKQDEYTAAIREADAEQLVARRDDGPRPAIAVDKHRAADAVVDLHVSRCRTQQGETDSRS